MNEAGPGWEAVIRARGVVGLNREGVAGTGDYFLGILGTVFCDSSNHANRSNSGLMVVEVVGRAGIGQQLVTAVNVVGVEVDHHSEGGVRAAAEAGMAAGSIRRKSIRNTRRRSTEARTAVGVQQQLRKMVMEPVGRILTAGIGMSIAESST